jgi:hypothetical protein
MPRIPSYREQGVPSVNVGAAPRPLGAADVAGGAVGKGIVNLGIGLENLGTSIYQKDKEEKERIDKEQKEIEEKKQAMRDDAAKADAVQAENDYVFEKEKELKGRVYKNIEEADADRKSSKSELSSFREQQAAGMSQEAFADYSNWSKKIEGTRLRAYEKHIYTNEVTMGQAKASIGLGRAYKVLYDPSSTDGDKLSAIESIAIIKAGNQSYFPPTELEATAVDAEVQAIIEGGGTVKDANKAIDRAADAGEITPDQKATAQRKAAAYFSTKKAQEKRMSAAVEAQINELNFEVVNTLADDPNNVDIINSLPTELKEAWEAKLVARDRFMKENPGAGDPFTNAYDPTVFNAFDTLLNSSPTKLPEVEIINKIGEGLTLADAKFLIDKKRTLEGTSKLRTNNPGFSSAYQRIKDAFENDTIKHPDYIPEAGVGSEDEKKNRIFVSGLLDEFTERAEKEDMSHAELNKYVDELLRPHQEMEAANFLGRVFSRFTYEQFVTNAAELRDAMTSLNKQAQKEWRYHKTTGMFGIDPWDFFHRWRSPNKIATPQIGSIYKKWAHGDEGRAEEMMLKDEWKIP